VARNTRNLPWLVERACAWPGTSGLFFPFILASFYRRRQWQLIPKFSAQELLAISQNRLIFPPLLHRHSRSLPRSRRFALTPTTFSMHKGPSLAPVSQVSVRDIAPFTHFFFVFLSFSCLNLSGSLCAQPPPEGIVLSKDIDISRVGCPSQTLHNEGTLAI
jgi:hypothetical protein